MPVRAVLYSRDLPGGGYVAIDVQQASQAAAAESAAAESVETERVGGDPVGEGAGPGVTHHARLWVERRADMTRRSGHTPPIIAQCSAPDLEHATAELRAIAADNVSLAQAIRRWRAERRAGEA